MARMKAARMGVEYTELGDSKNTELRRKDKVQKEYIRADSVLG
jgi:hypothetical protein